MNGPHLHLVGKPTAEVIDFGRGCFVAELMARRTPQPVEPEPVEPDRYTIRGWSGGLAVYDGWTRIATFEGQQWDLAKKLLRLLQAGDAAPTPPEAA